MGWFGSKSTMKIVVAVLLAVLIFGVAGFILSGQLKEGNDGAKILVEVEYKDGSREFLSEPSIKLPFAIYTSGSSNPVYRWILHLLVKVTYTGEATGYSLSANYKVEIEDPGGGIYTYTTGTISASNNTVLNGEWMDVKRMSIYADDLEAWLKSKNMPSGNYEMDVVITSGVFTLKMPIGNDEKSFSNIRLVIQFRYEPDGIQNFEIQWQASVTWVPTVVIGDATRWRDIEV